MTESAAVTRPAIISPLVDALCVGGLSLFLLLPLVQRLSRGETGRGAIL